MMHLLITLLLAHFLTDFPLQTNGIAKLKKERLVGVFLHVLIYVAITALTIQDPLGYWPLILGLGVAHFLIDAYKQRYVKSVAPFCFLVDQGFHLASIGLATLGAFTWYVVPPQSMLPYPLALMALACASLLAVMVFCWVWTNSLSEEALQRHILLRWTKRQMLELEQRIGLLLIGFVFAGPTYQWLTALLHVVMR
ncbi:MAG: DUF3307 domain-containing protein [Caldilineaceae bacterium]|nr:DUF3307 domain-containing protein [Caldilineaceae bacterium]